MNITTLDIYESLISDILYDIVDREFVEEFTRNEVIYCGYMEEEEYNEDFGEVYYYIHDIIVNYTLEDIEEEGFLDILDMLDNHQELYCLLKSRDMLLNKTKKGHGDK